MAIKFVILLALIAASTGVPANATSQNRSTRQYADDWYYDAYNLNPVSNYYEPSFRSEGFENIVGQYRNPFYSYYRGNYLDERIEGRLNGLGAAAVSNLFPNRLSSSNRRFRPFATLANLLPITLNPNAPSLFSTFDSCTSPTGESGICSPGSACSALGGRPSGSCAIAGVCCINAISTCGGTVTLNNTYWSSPTTGVTPAACSLGIKLDTQLLEQKKAICQIRVDFIAFAISQPDQTAGTTASVCTTDSFEVIGATNAVPMICGENSGQHMYIHVPSSDTEPSTVQLVFKMNAAVTADRTWKMKLSMLPCGASYLAPSDCLQYITSASGRIRSFNYADVNNAVRELANQDTNICFRTELLNGKRASSICLTGCSGIANRAFGVSNAAASLVLNQCSSDYVLFNGGTNTDASVTYTSDRYCGTAFNAKTASASTTVCSTIRPFRLYYHTNRGELAGETGAGGSTGFCFDFNQRS